MRVMLSCGEASGDLYAGALVEALRARGCTHAVLNASPSGRSVYERLGFQPSNEMRLTL